MSAARNRHKQQNRDVHHALMNAELAATRKAIKQGQQRQHAKNLFSMANLVLGGVIIGGIFQEVANRFLLYVIGIVAFVLFYIWGSILYKNSLK